MTCTRSNTTRIALAVAVLLALAALTGCGTSISARAETTIDRDGSGVRLLRFSVPKSSAADASVDMADAERKLRAAAPPFAQFKDSSDASTYRYEITFEFQNSKDLEEKAAWFNGSSAKLVSTGGVFARTISLDESFTPSNWFAWALTSVGRGESDLNAVEYVVRMPSPVSDQSPEGSTGTVTSNIFSKTGLSTSDAYDFSLRCEQRYAVDSLVVNTQIGPDFAAKRTLSFVVSNDTAAALEKDSGGTDALTQSLQSWAGDGWTAAASQTETGTAYTVTKASKSPGDLAFGGAQGSAEVRTVSADNRYVNRREFTESVDAQVWLPDQDAAAPVTYVLQTPWPIESVKPATGIERTGTSVTWKGTAGKGTVLTVRIIEVRSKILNPVLWSTIGFASFGLVLMLFGLARILTAPTR